MKKTLKNHLLRSHKGDEAETAEMFITLASTKFMFFIAFAHVHSNLKFPLTYNEKSESSSLLLSHCRYFDRTF